MIATACSYAVVSGDNALQRLLCYVVPPCWYSINTSLLFVAEGQRSNIGEMEVDPVRGPLFRCLERKDHFGVLAGFWMFF